MKDQAMITNEKMAGYLKELRHEKCYTMRALADKIGVPHSFIGKIEQKSRRMDIGEFILYCQALERDPVRALRAIMAMEDQ